MRLAWRGRGLLLAVALAACSGGGGPDPGAADRVRQEWARVSDGPVSVTVTPDGRTRTALLRVPYDASQPFDVASRAFLREHASRLGVADPDRDLSLAGIVPFGDLGDLAVFRLQHQGVPVLGAGVRLVGVGGAIRFVLVRVPPPFALSTAPRLDAAAAAARAAELHGMSMSPATEPRLVVLDTALLARGPGTGAGGAPALAWQMDVVTGGEDELVRDFVSAETGALLLGHPLVHGARDRRVFDGRSSAKLNEIVAAGARQWLDEAGPIAGVTIDPADAEAYADAQDAYDYAGRLYNFWINTLRHDSFDGAGSPIRVFVNHHDLRMEAERLERGNARWYPRWAHDPDGQSSGAFFFDLGMVAKDVFAHEYTHAVLDFATRSAPVYANESGAVEEAIADTFAALLEESDQPWTLGETTVVGTARSFADPHESTPWQPACYQERFVASSQGSCNPDPCMAEHTYCVESQCLYDAGGVHINSGIGARALYLMTQGSAGVPFDAPCELHDAPPILDRPKVAAFYALAVGLVDEHVSFFDLRAYVLAACRLLAEEHVTPLSAASEVTPADCAAVINAFASVGIGDPDTDLDGWDDREDNCPMVANDQADADGDDRGDACDDDAPECGECADPATLTMPECPPTVEVDSVDGDPSITTFVFDRYTQTFGSWSECTEGCNYARVCFYTAAGTETFFAFRYHFVHRDHGSGRPVFECSRSGWDPSYGGMEHYYSPTHFANVRLRDSGSGYIGVGPGRVEFQPARLEAFMASLMAEVEPLSAPCP